MFNLKTWFLEYFAAIGFVPASDEELNTEENIAPYAGEVILAPITDEEAWIMRAMNQLRDWRRKLSDEANENDKYADLPRDQKIKVLVEDTPFHEVFWTYMRAKYAIDESGLGIRKRDDGIIVLVRLSDELKQHMEMQENPLAALSELLKKAMKKRMEDEGRSEPSTDN